MSFKEQKIIRVLGRIVGDTNIVGVIYKDGRKETIVHEIKKKNDSLQVAPSFQMRGNLSA